MREALVSPSVWAKPVCALELSTLAVGACHDVTEAAAGTAANDAAVVEGGVANKALVKVANRGIVAKGAAAPTMPDGAEPVAGRTPLSRGGDGGAVWVWGASAMGSPCVGYVPDMAALSG